MKFEDLTSEQKAAVKETGSILVSAAAGSGKTAVLTERIAELLTRKEKPLSADRLLVVTFTVAASGEMRSRIEKRLDEYCREHPDDTYAFKQKLLLGSAKICTIDSFCTELLRDNFEKADVDPEFKIAEESDIITVSSVALSKVVKKYFEEENPAFFELLNAFGCVYDEKNLTDAIKEIYEKSVNLPFYRQWLSSAQSFCSEENIDVWLKNAFEIANSKTSSAVSVLKRALKFAENDESVYKAYANSLEVALKDLNTILKKLQNNDWDSSYELINSFGFERFGSVRGAADNPVAVRVKQTRDYILSETDTLKNLFFDTKENIFSGYKTVGANTAMLLKLTEEYDICFEAELKERGILTFSSIEQKALDLLCCYKDGNIVIKEDAKEYVNAFDEILVDEYQDVNDLQNTLFQILSDNGRNLFVVGDVKQSIYGFRGANPNNFLERRSRAVDYTAALNGESKKIILGSNFRSCKDVCDFVNFFFSMFMNTENCGMEYGNEDFLLPKADIPQSEDASTEVHFIQANSEIGEKASEAVHIAEYIESVMQKENAVYDKSLKCMRKARYSDFAVILRKMKGDCNIIASELKKRGIPVSYSKGEFTESREINIIVSLLSVISNPTHDIDLLSVMTSPIFSFTPEEIAKIRINSKEGNLYSAVLKSASAGNEKSQNFINKISDFRRLSVLYSLSKFISVLFDKTDLLNTVAMMSDGNLRKANLMVLLKEAAAYDNSSKGGLDGFLRYIKSSDAEKIKPAKLTSSGDAVQIMSVHYSKGLQFPICILGFLSSSFNTSDIRNSLVFDSEYGVSFKYFDEKEGKKDSIVRQILCEKAKKKMLSEELRLFYVAATRAENRLVLMLTFKDIETAVEKATMKAQITGAENSAEIFFTANNYADWIISVLFSHSEAGMLRAKTENSFNVLENCGHLTIRFCNITEESSELKADGEKQNRNSVNEGLLKELKERFVYVYPYEKILNLESKVSVSEVAHGGFNEEYDFSEVPAFMLEDGMTPAQKGTATHKVFQFINFFEAEKDINAELERLKEYNFISEAEFDVVDRQSIKMFLNSDIFMRMKLSDNLQREKKFITKLSAGYLYGDVSEDMKNELIVVQGAMDCVFVENDGVVIVDFKTDRVKDEETLINRYRRQLEIYAEACKKIYEMPVKQKIIYSLKLNKEITV